MLEILRNTLFSKSAVAITALCFCLGLVNAADSSTPMPTLPEDLSGVKVLQVADFSGDQRDEFLVWKDHCLWLLQPTEQKSFIPQLLGVLNLDSEPTALLAGGDLPGQKTLTVMDAQGTKAWSFSLEGGILQSSRELSSPVDLEPAKMEFSRRRMSPESVVNSSSAATAASLLQGYTMEAATASVAPFGYIDSPLSGSSQAYNMTISGWVYSRLYGPYVEVMVDGATVRSGISLNQRREDVCRALGTIPNCPYVGFSINLDISAYSVGAHTVVLRITTTDGVGYAANGTVQFLKSDTVIRGNTETPASGVTVTNSLQVTGWTFANYPVVSASALIDGNTAGTITTFAARPDVCAVFAGAANCMNSGYTFLLNTSSLSAGQHTLQIKAITNNGQVRIFTGIPFIKLASVIHGNLESPNTNQGSGYGPLFIGGWAVASQGVSSVDVMVDNVKLANAVYGTSRPDVCVTVGNYPGCPNVGFQYSLSYTGLALGSHSLRIIVRDLLGSTISLPATGPLTFIVAAQPTTTTTTTPTSTTTTSTGQTTTTTTSGGTTTSTTSGTPTTTSATGPVIFYLNPSCVAPGSGDRPAVTVGGIRFLAGAVVQIDGVGYSTTYGSGGSLFVTVPAAVTAVAGDKVFQVVNPSGSPTTSNTYVFRVSNSCGTPTTTGVSTTVSTSSTTTTVSGSTTTTLGGLPGELVFTSVTPSQHVLDGQNLTLTLRGVNFPMNMSLMPLMLNFPVSSVVNPSGHDLTCTVISSTEATVTVPGEWMTVAATTYPLDDFNRYPVLLTIYWTAGGGTGYRSNVLYFYGIPPAQ